MSRMLALGEIAMLKPLLVGACLAGSVLAGLGGCATQRGAPNAQTAANAPADVDCVKQTGTHIKDPDRKCVSLPGSSYTQQDLETTGQSNVGAALRQLDPRLH